MRSIVLSMRLASARAPGCRRPCRRCSVPGRRRRPACDPARRPAARACSPSIRAKKLTSSPSRNSSTTISAPAAPKPAVEHEIDGAERVLFGFGDDDAFTGGQPVRFDDDRQAQRLGVGFGRQRLAEAAIAAGRDAVIVAQILHEALGAFQDRALGAGAERLDARRFETVGTARRRAALPARSPQSRSFSPWRRRPARPSRRR